MHQQALTAVRFWYTHMFRDPTNWWFEVIGINANFAPACFLLNLMEPMNATDFEGCSKYMALSDLNSRYCQDYTNLVWVGTNALVSAAFWKNWTLAEDFTSRLAAQMHYTNGFADGPKVDGSFLYHGPQEYIGGYGQNFLSTVMDLVSDFFPSTSFQAKILSNPNGLAKWVVDSQKFINWPTNLHDMLDQGRGLTRVGCCGNGITAVELTKFAKYLKDPLRQEILDFAKRVSTRKNDPPAFIGNYHLWKGDYVAHRTPAFNTFLRMSSSRTRLMECCMNGENKRGQYITDGTMLTYFTGDEWRGLLPAMNFEQWPGTTVEQNQGFSCPSSRMGKNNFTGGVSSGMYGVTAMDFQASISGTVRAKKGWFFFDDVVIALGSNISWTSKLHVRTTVEQRPLKSEVYVNDATRPIRGNTSITATLDKPLWIHHGRIGYLFLGSSAEHVEIRAGLQSGNGEDIQQKDNRTVSVNFLNVGVAHSHQQSSYAYALFPALDLSYFAQHVNSFGSDVKVLQNSEVVQAVARVSKGIVGAVFWKPTSLRLLDGSLLSVSRPVCVIVQRCDSVYTVSISDPSQTANASVKIQLQGVSKWVNLPAGEFAGSTMVVQINTKGEIQ
eukprot:TRINITY_DN10703_c0_g3_i3.p1 TRINITY_DN10703_c0_g3~~TRINITY_DN10703_c0_g3_i3.p1  ORF type:complete len:612 (-),score=136.46 TRINITY_DN10703_c0_g3_i3:42-1877(-)